MATSDISKSPLYIDSTNGRVGIGTASPATALDLGTTIGAKLTLYPPTYSIGVESNELRIASNAVTSFYSGGHSGTERMRLTADGKVGIGSSSPSYKMTIFENGNNFLQFSSTGDAVAGHLIGRAGSKNLRVQNSENADTEFWTNNTERMRIGGSGNVGIGNSNPQHKFHITHSGTGTIPTDYQMGATSPNDNYQGIHNNNNSATFSGLALETRTSGASRWLIANEWKNTYLGDLVFRNRNAALTSQESMRIDSSGRVTMPYQPAFNAINGLNSNGTAYVIPFTTAVTNVGGHYNTSTYRFTAPVAGTYFFMHNGMSNNGYNRTRYSVNGSFVGNEFFSVNVGYANFVGSIILTLAVGDYVEVWNDVQSSSQGDMHSNYRAFSGFLIG